MAWRESCPPWPELVGTYLDTASGVFTPEFPRFHGPAKAGRKRKYLPLTVQPQSLCSPAAVSADFPTLHVSLSALQDALQVWVAGGWKYRKSTRRTTHQHGEARQLFDGCAALLLDHRQWSANQGTIHQVYLILAAAHKTCWSEQASFLVA